MIASYRFLDFAQTPAQARNAASDVHPPIVALLKAKPWLIANLYAGRIPEAVHA